MTLDCFTSLLDQVLTGPAVQRLVFIWVGQKVGLDNLLTGFDVHRCDPASAYPDIHTKNEDPRRGLQSWLGGVCKGYENTRKEPSALLTENAILLIRYGCDLSAYFRHAISPRSAAILLMPPPTQKQLPIRAEAWVKNNTPALLMQLAHQLGEPGCVIQA